MRVLDCASKRVAKQCRRVCGVILPKPCLSLISRNIFWIARVVMGFVPWRFVSTVTSSGVGWRMSTVICRWMSSARASGCATGNVRGTWFFVVSARMFTRREIAFNSPKSDHRSRTISVTRRPRYQPRFAAKRCEALNLPSCMRNSRNSGQVISWRAVLCPILVFPFVRRWKFVRFGLLPCLIKANVLCQLLVRLLYKSRTCLWQNALHLFV